MNDMSGKTDEAGQENTDRWDMDWIYNFFRRWDEEMAAINRVKHQAAQVLLQDKHLPEVQAGEILFLTNKNTLDLKDEVYILLQWKAQKIGIIKSNIISAGRMNAKFFPTDEKAFQIKEKSFVSSDSGRMEKDIKEWLLSKLSVMYPEDYKKTQKEEPEEVRTQMTPQGITYIIRSGTENKDHSLMVYVENEAYNFERFWFWVVWKTFYVWIVNKEDGVPILTINKLKNKTLANDKDFKSAIEKMIGKIVRLLKTKDPKMIDVQTEIKKYIQIEW